MKEALKEIVRKITNFESHISFHIDQEKNIERVFNALRYDYVVTFHIGRIDYLYSKEEKTVIFTPEYLINKDNYDALLKKCLSKLSDIKKMMMNYSSDLEKEKFIHDYLIKNVTYEDIGFESHSIVGPLLLGKGVCEGIAKTSQALLKIAKIESHVICGTSIQNKKETPHSWNAIKIDGKWYLNDFTFDLTLSNGFINYNYFNVSKNRISKTHIPEIEYKEITDLCVNERNYFEMNNCSFNSEADVMDYLEKSLKHAEKHIYFEYKNNDSTFKDRLFNTISSYKKTSKVSLRWDEPRCAYHFGITY